MGFNETDVKALAVIPKTEPGSRSTVTTVTPVANCPRALRKSRAVSAVAIILRFLKIPYFLQDSSARLPGVPFNSPTARQFKAP